MNERLGIRASGFAVSALLPVAILAGVLPACNAVLGFEKADLDDGGAVGTDAASGSQGQDGATPECADLAKGPCESCLAAECCAEYSACLRDDRCKAEFTAFSRCMVLGGRDDAGVSCPEQLATGDSPEAKRLATCLFLDERGRTRPCAGACSSSPILTEACASYCACMRETCSDYLKPALCATECLATGADLECRTTHCLYATQGDAPLHCQHALGKDVCR